MIPSYSEGLNQLRAELNNIIPKNALKIFDNDAEMLNETHISILKKNIGDQAINFTLSNPLNKKINLFEILKTKRVVLTFYRGTWCPYCNLQLYIFQQILPQLKSLGTELIAISPQSPDASLSIKEKNELDFHVLSDAGNIVAREYTQLFTNSEKSIQTMYELGYDYDSFYLDKSRELPVPAIFIIEQTGLISYAKTMGGDYRNRIEPKEILDALKKDTK